MKSDLHAVPRNGTPRSPDAPDQAAATIVHDFNNSLTTILGLTEWLLATLPVGAAGRSEIVHIRAAALEAASLVPRVERLAVAMPAAAERAAPVPPPPVRAPSSHADALTVLLVDDQPEVRDTVGEMLGALGHHVSVAADATAAMALLDEGFDVVVTDYGMPGMNGVQLAREIHGKRPGLPVVLLTGWGSGQEEHCSPDIALVVPKPITMRGLRDALASVVPRDVRWERACARVAAVSRG
jgi:CheY-like chemotaxis protein